MKRNNYFDFLRGLAILSVIAIHSSRASQFDSGVAGNFNLAFRQLCNCAVPIFFAISGYCLGAKRLEKKSEVSAFYRHQISKVYFPCLVWSFPFLLTVVLKNPSGIIRHSLVWLVCGYSVYYFIAVIIQFYLFLPVFVRVRDKKRLLAGGV